MKARHGQQTDRQPALARLPMASPIATWLANAGCEHDGLTDVLIACGGGDSLEQLKAVKEAELLLKVGKIGLRGIKLRKLLAALQALPTPTDGIPAAALSSATGGSAFSALVAKEGPPPS